MIVIVIDCYVSRLFEFVIYFTCMPTGGSALNGAKNYDKKSLEFYIPFAKMELYYQIWAKHILHFFFLWLCILCCLGAN